MSAFATSYIGTGASAVTRAADALTYPSAGNISNITGTVYLEYVINTLSLTNWSILKLDGTNSFMFAHQTFGIRSSDGTSIINGPTVTITVPMKASVSWSGASRSVTSNGLVPSTGAYATPAFTLIDLGAPSAQTGAWSSTIRNVNIWSTALTADQLKRVTT